MNYFIFFVIDTGIHKGSRKFYSQAEVEDLLASARGGSVDLQKDDETGIATVTLNHPAKKNAMSGMPLSYNFAV